jgi:hypothetical protein
MHVKRAGQWESYKQWSKVPWNSIPREAMPINIKVSKTVMVDMTMFRCSILWPVALRSNLQFLNFYILNLFNKEILHKHNNYQTYIKMNLFHVWLIIVALVQYFKIMREMCILTFRLGITWGCSRKRRQPLGWLASVRNVLKWQFKFRIISKGSKTIYKFSDFLKMIYTYCKL